MDISRQRKIGLTGLFAPARIQVRLVETSLVEEGGRLVHLTGSDNVVSARIQQAWAYHVVNLSVALALGEKVSLRGGLIYELFGAVGSGEAHISERDLLRPRGSIQVV